MRSLGAKIRNRFAMGGAAVLAAALLMGGVAAPSGGAHAQTQDPAAEAEQEVEGLRTAPPEDAAAASFLRRDCPPVSYADVLRAPDDPTINICYAVGQIEEGDLPGAAATLERLLILQPRQTEVRLLYALVLYRMEIYRDAAEAFRAVRESDLSPEDDARVAAYLDRIEKQLQTTQQTVTVSLGGHYDTNRNAAPRGEESLVAGAVTPISDGSSRVNDDTGVLGVVGYDIRHDLGMPRNHAAVGSITYYQDDQTERDELDLQAVFVEGGFELDAAYGVTVTPKLRYSNMRLSREKFFTGMEGSVRVDLEVNEPGREAPIDLWAKVSHAREAFQNIDENRSLAERDGMRTEGSAGIGYWLTPRHRLQATGLYGYKAAERRYLAHHVYSLALDHTWLLGEGAFLLNHVSYAARMYQTPDPAVTSAAAPQRRREHPLRVRVTYGAPAGLLLDKAGYQVRGEASGAVRDFLEDVTATVSAEYLTQQSNIRNYEYKNYRGQVLLTKRYEF